jgi:hypothetical protein
VLCCLVVLLGAQGLAAGDQAPGLVTARLQGLVGVGVGGCGGEGGSGEGGRCAEGAWVSTGMSLGAV